MLVSLWLIDGWRRARRCQVGFNAASHLGPPFIGEVSAAHAQRLPRAPAEYYDRLNDRGGSRPRPEDHHHLKQVILAGGLRRSASPSQEQVPLLIIAGATATDGGYRAGQ